MKTIFKKGMKVYDQMFFPYVEGRIIEIHDKYDKIQIEVKFFSKDRLEPLCMQSSVFYSEKGTMLNFLGHSCKISTLSTKPYQIDFQNFEQKAPVQTYEEVIKGKNYIYLPENLVAPNKELADATVALLKLLFLRDYYNDGWQPDWEDEEEKFSIQVCEGEFHTFESIECQRVVSFKTPEIRDKFLEEQRELLEIAKPLL
jgi:hypothetical protein